MSLSILIAIISALLNRNKPWWHFAGSESFECWPSRGGRRGSRSELRNEELSCLFTARGYIYSYLYGFFLSVNTYFGTVN